VLSQRPPADDAQCANNSHGTQWEPAILLGHLRFVRELLKEAACILTDKPSAQRVAIAKVYRASSAVVGP
jgi:hypothetical protein